MLRKLGPLRYWRWTIAALLSLLAVLHTDTLASTQPVGLTIDGPVYNAVVANEEMVIRGSARPGDVVRHERRMKSDPEIAVDDEGKWEYPVGLKRGKNTYTFHLEGSNKTKAKVVLFYNPGALDALSVVDPVGLPTVDSQEITIRGKAKPGDSVLHEKTRAKDPEIPVDADGNWEYRVRLKKGENNYTFHLGSSESTKAGATVKYDPEAAPPTSTPAPLAPSPTPSGETVTVARVVDGDTIELRDGRRLRYIGIDTPETVDPGQPVGCYGKEASDRNKALVEGKTVSLEKDVSETDRFGRLLRYVYLPSGEMVNELLVAEGYAQASSFPPDIKYQERFTAAQQQARDAGRGLWGPFCQPTAVPPTQAPVQAPPVAPPAPPTAAPPPPSGNCSPAYPTVCIPPAPPDLDCPQIPYRRFQVLPPDPHRFDADFDGIGCETG